MVTRRYVIILVGVSGILNNVTRYFILWYLIACHCTDLYLFNLFVHLANKLSLSRIVRAVRTELNTVKELTVEWHQRQ